MAILTIDLLTRVTTGTNIRDDMDNRRSCANFSSTDHHAYEASEVEETKAPCSLSMKLNVISGQTFGMVPQGNKIQSIFSVWGNQVIRNLIEPLEAFGYLCGLSGTGRATH